MSRRFQVSAGDTRLAAVDIPGGSPPLLLVNGGFATTRHWSRVVQRVAGAHRVIEFDARGRGKSGRSRDYSLAGAVDDLGHVLEAAGDVDGPILIGWSHGATLAVRYAAQHPDQVAGLVLVDGAYPLSMFDEAGKDKVRAQFRKLGPLMRLAALFGLGARTTPAQSAEIVIEMDQVNGDLGEDYAALRCPAAFVLGTGSHSGATEEEMRTMRAAVGEAVAENELVYVFATAPVNHVQILRKAPDVVVSAIEEVVRQGTEGFSAV